MDGTETMTDDLVSVGGGAARWAVLAGALAGAVSGATYLVLLFYPVCFAVGFALGRWARKH